MEKTKDRLLLYLKENKGSWASGEDLSQRLGVSRAAVNKHIHSLRKMGYPIEASTRRGYMLSGPYDLLLADEIREGLEARTFGAKEIICLPRTDSTNLRAKDLAAAGAPEGALVIAEEQTAGRGRKGRSWHSPVGGGIYMSLVLRPSMTPSEAPQITLMTGVAAAEALLSLTQLDVKIKWPNDLLVGGKKIAGILTELSTEMDRIDYVVVGIGMNVNVPAEDLAPELREIATSVLIEAGGPLSRTKLIRAFLESFEGWYRLLQETGFVPIGKRWRELSNIIGRRVSVEMIGRRLSGEAVDIDAEGVLILKDNEGAHHRIISGDVLPA